MDREGPQPHLVADLLAPGDLVVLVVPIDSAAPKGRLILPQQQTIRDILEARAVSVVTGVEELPQTLQSLGKAPRLVITDSQAFGAVNKLVPRQIPLTSFSILMARYKGTLDQSAAEPPSWTGCRTGTRCSSPRAAPTTASARTSAR